MFRPVFCLIQVREAPSREVLQDRRAIERALDAATWLTLDGQVLAARRAIAAETVRAGDNRPDLDRFREAA